MRASPLFLLPARRCKTHFSPAPLLLKDCQVAVHALHSRIFFQGSTPGGVPWRTCFLQRKKGRAKDFYGQQIYLRHSWCHHAGDAHCHGHRISAPCTSSPSSRGRHAPGTRETLVRTATGKRPCLPASPVLLHGCARTSRCAGPKAYPASACWRKKLCGS